MGGKEHHLLIFNLLASTGNIIETKQAQGSVGYNTRPHGSFQYFKNIYVRMIIAFSVKAQRIPRFGPALHA